MVEGKEGEGVMRQTDRMRVLIGIRTKCGTSNNEGNSKGNGQGRPRIKKNQESRTCISPVPKKNIQVALYR